MIEGPFPEHYRAIVYGYEVPHIKIYKTAGGNVEIVLDNRLSIVVPEVTVDYWMPLVAHAMAFGAGYSCFGENSIPRNDYKHRISTIDEGD